MQFAVLRCFGFNAPGSDGWFRHRNPVKRVACIAAAFTGGAGWYRRRQDVFRRCGHYGRAGPVANRLERAGRCCVGYAEISMSIRWYVLPVRRGFHRPSPSVQNCARRIGLAASLKSVASRVFVKSVGSSAWRGCRFEHRQRFISASAIGSNPDAPSGGFVNWASVPQ